MWGMRIHVCVGLIIALGAADGSAQGNRSDTEELDQISAQIDRRRRALPSQPEYLYATDSFADAVSTVWTDITRPVLGTDELRSKYDDFYSAALEYHAAAQLHLIYAERHVKVGNARAALNSLDDFAKSINLLAMSEKGAFAVWDGDLNASQELARGIYNGSKASLMFAGWATKPLLGPSASSLIDGMFTVTDFAIDSTASSLDEATKNAVSKIIARGIFRYGGIDALGGRSLSGAIDDGVTLAVGQSGLNSVLDGILSSRELRQGLMSIFTNSTSGAIQKLSEDQYTKIVNAITNMSQVSPDSLSVASDVPPGQNTPAEIGIDETGPDLRFGYGKLLLSTQVVAPGDEVLAEFTVANDESEVAEPSTARLRLVPDGAGRPTPAHPMLLELPVPEIGPKNYIGVSGRFTLPADTVDGQYRIWGILDVNRSTGQDRDHEDNDFASARIKITTRSPDLFLQSMYVSPNQKPGQRDAEIQLRIRNSGDATSKACRLNLRVNDTGSTVTTRDPLLATLQVPPIGAGASEDLTTTITWPNSIRNGTYHVWGIVDVDSTAGQAVKDEINDRKSRPVRLQF